MVKTTWKRVNKENPDVVSSEIRLVSDDIRIMYPTIVLRVQKMGSKWFFGIKQRHNHFTSPLVTSIVPFTSMKDAKHRAELELEKVVRMIQQ